MKKYMTLCAAAAALLVLGGCASLKPPVRPAYTGTDNVIEVEPSKLVGKWVVTDLNPYPDAEPQSTIIEYRDDGTVVGMIEPQGESMKALGDMRFELTGQWQLDGDIVSHSDVEMSSSSDSAMGTMISKMMNRSKGISGQANIYELSDNRIVMVGSDGAAMEYRRQ